MCGVNIYWVEFKRLFKIVLPISSFYISNKLKGSVS